MPMEKTICYFVLTIIFYIVILNNQAFMAQRNFADLARGFV